MLSKRVMLKTLDIFPKASDTDITVRTNAGGILSLCSLAFLIYSITTEIRKFAIISTRNKMVLCEKPLPTTLPIFLDISVANNCSLLHADVTNVKRNMDLDAVMKTDFQQNGNMCDIKLNITAPNIPGSFHIGLGDSYADKKNEHSHLWYTIDNKNLSHKINKIRFGDIDVASPMDDTGITLIKPIAYMTTYSIQLMAVTKDTQVGYQAVATASKTNLEKIRTRGITAIVFQWNFSPIGVNSTTAREPVIELVCHLLAVVGCFFVFVRFFDNLVFMLQVCK